MLIKLLEAHCNISVLRNFSLTLSGKPCSALTSLISNVFWLPVICFCCFNETIILRLHWWLQLFPFFCSGKKYDWIHPTVQNMMNYHKYSGFMFWKFSPQQKRTDVIFEGAAWEICKRQFCDLFHAYWWQIRRVIDEVGFHGAGGVGNTHIAYLSIQLYFMYIQYQ